jgi:antibiotic biosynthesis monooxygenase (ABM) superfamily enzyme
VGLTVAPNALDEPVTVVSARRIRPGREADYEAWLVAIEDVARQFPGFMGRRVIRPADHAHPEYVVVFKFDNYSHLKAWTESDTRREWLERVRPMVLDELREQVLTGLERWFTLSDRPGLAPPPRYKMATVTLLVVYPLGLGINRLLPPLLAPVPQLLQSLLASALMVALMTYVIMPRATRLFRRWLYPDA